VLEAAKDMDAPVIVAAGGRGTEVLSARYPQPNIVIRDVVDFASELDFTDVFITNGGFGVGISLKTERPKPRRIAQAVQEIPSNAAWRTRAQQMRDHFAAGDPAAVAPAAVAAAVVEKAAGLAPG
jgi:UDP:flavonoid glycosyltransferase YjiC (YdhE family)